MKCPQCGRWNRATLPQCFYCGAALPKPDGSAEQWEKTHADLPQQSESVIYRVDEDGRSTRPQMDERDKLAREMQSFHTRRKRGQEQQRRILQRMPDSGLDPAGGGTWNGASTTRIYSDMKSGEDAGSVPDGETRPGATPVPLHNRETVYAYDDYEETPAYQPLWNDHYPPRPANRGMSPRSMRHVHAFGLRRFLPFIALILIVSALFGSAYYFLVRPYLERKNTVPESQVTVFPSILNDMAAHTIQIPADENAVIYIKELRKSYTVIGGYAEIVVADYTWYELAGVIESETMDVTLTPYIKTGTGEQRLMDPITYTIEIPLSPLTLLTPASTYEEVSTSPYTISFQVAQNSTVFINGEDYSSFVNTQNGKISYNATVQPIGENVFDIVVNCQYYRQNTLRVTIYRAPQDIPLELSATLSATSSEQLMTIRGTTLPGANLTITSPYQDLDTSLLNTTGEFAFQARFDKIGTNTITIIADKDGHSAEISKDIYYVPYASVYTPKAWPMDAAGYIDFLNNTATRVQRTQIYECIGTITEILGTRPQLALMDTGEEGSERLILLENRTNDTWEIGSRYRIYADAYGVYDGKPRLVARYTYLPRN